MDCPICYQPVSVDDEAYVASCYHRFCHKCISAWTVQQRRHPIPEDTVTRRGGSRTEYRCPMCKQTYDYILYDCVLNSFRIQFVDDEARRRGHATVGSGAGMSLSAGHRRRRALYLKQPPQQQERPPPPQQQPGQLGQAPASTGSGREQPLDDQIAGSGVQDPTHPSSTTGAALRAVQPAAGRRTATKIRGPDDPELQDFVERELQALLLQEDVGMLLQHVLGVLRNALGSSASGGGSGRSGARGGGGGLAVPAARSTRSTAPPAKLSHTTTMVSSLPPRQDFERVVSREMTSFLPQDSLAFASQLYLFLASGLTVGGYDRAVFGPDVAAPKAKIGPSVRTEGLDVVSHRQVLREAVDLLDDDEYEEVDDDFDDD